MRVQVAACVPALVPNVQYLEVYSRLRFEFANVSQGAINVLGTASSILPHTCEAWLDGSPSHHLRFELLVRKKGCSCLSRHEPGIGNHADVLRQRTEMYLREYGRLQ